ncbi:hypothetical protein V7165_24215, partial [Priestia megaterium]|uniref:hypothetical protein n=1 Tax=Priestia megaterium TaxID=1404 RepID=UPI003008F945
GINDSIEISESLPALKVGLKAYYLLYFKIVVVIGAVEMWITPKNVRTQPIHMWTDCVQS